MGIGALRRYHNIPPKPPAAKPVVEVPDGTFTDKTKRLDHFRTDRPVKPLTKPVKANDAEPDVQFDTK